MKLSKNAGLLDCSTSILVLLVRTASLQWCSCLEAKQKFLVVSVTIIARSLSRVGQEQTKSQLWWQKSERGHFHACQRLSTTWTFGIRPLAASFIKSLGMSHTCRLYIVTVSHSNAPSFGISGSCGMTNRVGKPNRSGFIFEKFTKRGTNTAVELTVLPYYWCKTNVSRPTP